MSFPRCRSMSSFGILCTLQYFSILLLKRRLKLPVVAGDPRRFIDAFSAATVHSNGILLVNCLGMLVGGHTRSARGNRISRLCAMRRTPLVHKKRTTMCFLMIFTELACSLLTSIRLAPVASNIHKGIAYFGSNFLAFATKALASFKQKSAACLEGVSVCRHSTALLAT